MMTISDGTYRINPHREDAETLGQQASVFMDKIRLSALIIDKEGQLCGVHAKLIWKIKAGFIDPDDETDLQKSSDFLDCWRVCHELYTFLKHNEISIHRNRDEFDISVLNSIFEKYLKPRLTMTYDDLNTAVDKITSIISAAGYHNTALRDEDSLDREENG